MGVCTRIQFFWSDEHGVTSIEYALVASLIVVVIIAAVSALGAQVCERFNAVAGAFGVTDLPVCL